MKHKNKPRPTKYAPKLKLNCTFGEAMQVATGNKKPTKEMIEPQPKEDTTSL